MPSLYHFNSDQFKENLILGGQQHMVAGRLCQYLKGWQLDGIRFLYKHFEKGESCILNDESGLGKVVTTAVFLGAVLNNDTTKKCLIIARDDEYIEGWRFHLSVLTQLSVKVIERTSDINQETVFLIKWSTLKDIGQISKTTFDHIIVDNRGEMLTNKFCTGILLRYYENKISIVISSSDVTSDIKLLHTLLRLCGRLDRQYADVEQFEQKFQLPTLKDGVRNKIDLEDYFLKREKVINFCREFRLRRYCHQFEEQFPLVPCHDFKRYLQQWRSSLNSQSSGSAKLCSSSSEKDVEELFQTYFRIKQERDDLRKDSPEGKQNETLLCDDNRSNSSDELLLMSPLLFVSESESDGEQTQLRNESVTLLSDEIKEEDENANGITSEKENAGEKEIMATKVDRRKLTKPVKKMIPSPAELNNAKSLRNRKVPSVTKVSSKAGTNEKLEKSENTPRKRGRPVGKKCIQSGGAEKQSVKESKAEASESLKKVQKDASGQQPAKESKAEGKETSEPRKKLVQKDASEKQSVEESHTEASESGKKVQKDASGKQPVKESKAEGKEASELRKKLVQKDASAKHPLKESKPESREASESGKKVVQKDASAKEPHASAKQPVKESKVASKEASERDNESKERRAIRVGMKAANDEAKKNEEPKEKDGINEKNDMKKKDAALESDNRKIQEKKDEEKTKKASPPNTETTSRKGDKSLSEKSTNKHGLDKAGENRTSAKIATADVIKIPDAKPQNSKPSEKKDSENANPENDNKTIEANKLALRRTRSMLDPEKDKLDSAVKVKKKKLLEDETLTKQSKEKENLRRRAINGNVKKQEKLDHKDHNESISKKTPRHMQLDLVLEEANKFLKVMDKFAAKNGQENSSKEGSRRKRLFEKLPLQDKSTSSLDSPASKSPKTPNSAKRPTLNRSKDRSDTPKRCKPLTVYTLLGVHSRSTRGMQRYTRSSALQNKYMKVSEAQVGLDKLSKPRRSLVRRQSITAERPQPSNKQNTNAVREPSENLESMQLGQALTPTNGFTLTQCAAPVPRKVGYDFPLMLDKDIPDSECIITSQNSNNNEVIILTGSSITDCEGEMEPPKSTVSLRETSSMKPPMVTIPRQTHSKAKSPDLFSTCSDLSLPCSQQKSTKSTFDGFKIFGSEVRQHLKSSQITQPQTYCFSHKNDSALRKELQDSPTNQPVEDEDAMFEITSNGTFSNMIRVNSNGELSPIRNKHPSGSPSVSNHKNRITNYLISSNQPTKVNGTSPSQSLDDQIDNLQKTPKRRKSLCGTTKRSPRSLSGSKPQSTKLTQWLIKNNPVVRISDKSLKTSSTKRKRLDLLFPDDK